MASEPSIRDQYIQQALAAGFTLTVLEHAANPRNVGSHPDADGRACVVGPCADTMSMWLRIGDGRIEAVKFWTDGCGPTIATGSMTTELMEGKSIQQALQLGAEDVLAALGGLPEGHRHCAQLAVDTLHAAVRDYLDARQEPWKNAYRRQ